MSEEASGEELLAFLAGMYHGDLVLVGNLVFRAYGHLCEAEAELKREGKSMPKLTVIRKSLFEIVKEIKEER